MIIKLIKQSEKELQFVIEGETYTLFNLLQDELLRDKRIDFVGYNVPHPLFKKAIFRVRAKTAKNKPKQLVLEAIERIHENIKEFEKEWKACIEKG